MSETINHHNMQLIRDRSTVLLVDVQEKLRPVMSDGEIVIEECVRVIQAANALGVPVLCTEQYPKGLGKTVPELASLLREDPIEKMAFSCYGASVLVKRLKELKRDQIVVIGIESHVCVMQTTLDLLAAAYQVHVPFDAVTSRSRKVREMALARMRQAGAVITCVESVLFEWLQEAGTDEFKTVAKMIRREIIE